MGNTCWMSKLRARIDWFVRKWSLFLFLIFFSCIHLFSKSMCKWYRELITAVNITNEVQFLYRSFEKQSSFQMDIELHWLIFHYFFFLIFHFLANKRHLRPRFHVQDSQSNCLKIIQTSINRRKNPMIYNILVSCNFWNQKIALENSIHNFSCQSSNCSTKTSDHQTLFNGIILDVLFMSRCGWPFCSEFNTLQWAFEK